MTEPRSTAREETATARPWVVLSCTTSLDGCLDDTTAQRLLLSNDADFDRVLLRHIAILKLAEEEAHTILGGDDLEELRGLGVPEVVVTFGAGGSLVLTRDAAVRVVARASRGDPTGAGDAFSVAYLSARAGGHRPISAARRASALVSALMAPPR